MRKRLLQGFRVLAVGLLGHLPRPLAGPVSRVLGGLFMKLDSRGRKRGLANMARVGVGGDDAGRLRLLRAMYNHLALMVIEILWNHRHLDKCLDRLELEGQEAFDQALAQGKGALLISMHLGNWEYSGTLMGLLYPGTGAIVRQQPDQGLDALLWQQRKAGGVVTFPNTRDQAPAMLAHVRSGKPLGLLMDVYATREHPPSPFLGVSTPTFLGPAAQARDYGCPVFLAYSVRLAPFRHRMFLEPLPVTFTDDREADLRRVTDQFNQEISARILKNPDQWLWIMKRWKD